MRHITFLSAILLTLTVLSGCGGKEHRGDYSNVMIYYGGGYNDLASSLLKNLDELGSGDLPSRGSGNAIVAFCHVASPRAGYSTPCAPALIHIYKKRGHAVMDTLKVYNAAFRDTDPDNIRMVLDDVREKFPSNHFGLLYSSHATGWIPPGYKESNNVSLLSTETGRDSENEFPETKSIGAQFLGNTTVIDETELREFAAAIPMHLDYIIFDACLMGCIEVAWELKDVCDKIVFSPTEILKQGLIYEKMAAHLMRNPADLQGVCKDYYDYYEELDTRYSDCSITLVDCRKIEAVAKAMAIIFENHRANLSTIVPRDVQRYYYDSSHKPWYYDIRDFAVHLGANQTELSALDSALDRFVVYKAATESFFNVPLEHYSGISCYIPVAGWTSLNQYYRTLGWNTASGLLK